MDIRCTSCSRTFRDSDSDNWGWVVVQAAAFTPAFCPEHAPVPYRPCPQHSLPQPRVLADPYDPCIACAFDTYLDATDDPAGLVDDIATYNSERLQKWGLYDRFRDRLDHEIEAARTAITRFGLGAAVGE